VWRVRRVPEAWPLQQVSKLHVTGSRYLPSVGRRVQLVWLLGRLWQLGGLLGLRQYLLRVLRALQLVKSGQVCGRGACDLDLDYWVGEVAGVVAVAGVVTVNLFALALH
jgi:hypothetical protein